MYTPVTEPLPPANCRRIVEEFAALVNDPVKKLRFLKRVIERYQAIPSIHKRSPAFQERVVKKLAINEAERLCPGTRKKAKELSRQGKISAPGLTCWNIYACRSPVSVAVVAVLALGLGTGIVFFRNTVSSVSGVTQESIVEYGGELYGVGDETFAGVGKVLPLSGEKDIVYTPDSKESDFPEYIEQPVWLVEGASHSELSGSSPERSDTLEARTGDANVSPRSGVRREAHSPESEESDFPEYIEQPIWLVEKGANGELYSNGLRIITTFTVENEPRKYYPFPRNSNRLPSGADISNDIVGILYHASESDIIDFTPKKNHSLKRYSKALVKYVCQKKSYHYFIDRFGRVFRVVKENHAAFHAGNSVWADDENVYLDLNDAFIGICFEGKDFWQGEARAEAASLAPVNMSTINEAQLTSGKELTDYLRVKYHISQQNCVTHALVSINPKGRLIGYHLDLSRDFPFHRFGLTDKSRGLLPAITEFGFGYDSYFVKVFEGNIWPGIGYSEEHMRRCAELANVPLANYRVQLNKRFLKWCEWQERQKDGGSETDDQARRVTG